MRLEAGILVSFDQTSYTVADAGDRIVAFVTIDGDDAFPDYQGIRDGLYSYALRIKYPEGKAIIGVQDIQIPPLLDNNGFDSAPATRKVGIGYASVEGIIGFTNKYYGPDVTAFSDPAGTWPLIVRFVITNLAKSGESYQISLESADTTRSNRWYCAYNSGKNTMAVDDQLSFGAATINVNTKPMIAPIGDQVVEYNNSTAKIPLVIYDKETASDKLTVNAFSDNSFLIPTNHIAIDTAGTNRTITVTPFLGESGQTVVTIVVSDGQLVAQTQFKITVKPQVLAPMKFVQIQKLTNDFVHIVFSASIGTNFRLESTSDFITWNHMAYFTMTNASHEYLDLIFPPQQQRFYRLSR